MRTSSYRWFPGVILLGVVGLLGGVLTAVASPEPHATGPLQKEKPKPPWNTIRALAIALDSKTAATLSDDGSVDIWDLTQGQKDRKFPEPLRHIPKVVWERPSGALAWSPDGKRFFV